MFFCQRMMFSHSTIYFSRKMNDIDAPISASSKTTRESFQTSNTSEEANAVEIEEGRLPAILGYIPFLFFVPLFGAKNNAFALRHGQQAFALFLIEMVALLFLIDAVSKFFWTVIFIACLGLALIACAHAAQGKFWKIPYLSEAAKKKFDAFGTRQGSQ
jgi:uncharacterized membrane protein